MWFPVTLSDLERQDTTGQNFLEDFCVPILLCFLGQLSHLPYSFFGASVTNLNKPPRALAASTISGRCPFGPL